MMTALWLVVLSALGAAAQPPGKSSNMTEAALGKRLYEARCQACHGADGKGSAAFAKDVGAYPPDALDLTKPAVQELDDAALARRIEAGHGKMKGFHGKLSARELSQVAAYLRLIGQARAGGGPSAGS